MISRGTTMFDAGDAAQAVNLGRRAVAINRYREDAHRLIIKGYAAGGRKSEALTHFRELSAFLDAELSVLPDAETRRLADDLDSQTSFQSPRVARVAPAAPDPTPVANNAPERRNVTVLVCNFFNSAGGAFPLDPEDLQSVLASFHEMIAGVASKFGGYLAASSGNAVQAYFGYPRASGYEAAQAVRAGLSILAMERKLVLPGGTRAAVSVGIATGPVIFSRHAAASPSVVGEVPDIAARLQASAAPGTILLSHKTRLILGEMFEFRANDLGVSNSSPGTTAWTVLAERAGLSRFELERGKMFSPLVGRHHEMDMLTRSWERAKEGEGQAVLIVGEAGIGKSRLSEALVAAAEVEPNFLVRYQCSPYHVDSAFYPVIHHITATAGFAPDDSNETRLDRLEDLLTKHADGATWDEAATLATLVGLDTTARYGADTGTPLQRRNRTLAVLVNQMEQLSRRKPVLWLIEDAHWIDPTTLELVALALERIGASRVLLIITARPGFEPPLASHPDLKRLVIGRLARQPLLAIARHVAGDRALPDPLADDILSRTDGNPLFVEEMTKAVIDSGPAQGTGDADGSSWSAAESGVPATLQDSLMERLERLTGVKDLVQMASVIGRTFDQSVLADLSTMPPDDLFGALDRLVAAEVFYREVGSRDATLTFKHALLRDAAYESILRPRRTSLHRALFEVLVAQGQANPELRAQHAERAGMPEAALKCWEEAGRSAISRSAFKEAVAAFRAAIRICGGLGSNHELARHEQRLHVEMGQALIASEGYAGRATMMAFARATELADAIGTPVLQLPALYGLWASRYVRVERSDEPADRFFRIADAERDEGPRLVGLRMLALERFHAGHLREALELTDRSIALYRAEAHGDLKLRFGSDPRVAAGQYRAWCLWHLGLVDQAVSQMEQSLAWARDCKHVNTLGLALHGVAVTGTWLRLGPPAERLMREAVRLSEEMSLVHTGAWAAFFLGLALHRQHKDGALAQIENGLSRIRRNEDKRFNPLQFSCMAEVYSECGRHEDAANAIELALAALIESKDDILASDLYRIRAKIVLAADVHDFEPAEADLLNAIRIANAQGALTLELRAATDLASHYIAQGERLRAASVLDPLCGSRTEGLVSQDFVHARRLLAQTQ